MKDVLQQLKAVWLLMGVSWVPTYKGLLSYSMLLGCPLLLPFYAAFILMPVQHC